MRNARIAATAALVLSVTSGLPLVGTASADTATLYVNNGTASGCSDTSATAGSQATPFCTISAAALVVQPGETVQIAAGYYSEQVNLTRSGTPDAPITFVGPNWWATPGSATIDGNGLLSLTGVHDVTVRHLQAGGTNGAVRVTDSSRVTLDGLMTSSYNDGSGANPAVHIGGHSDGVTLSRTGVRNSAGDGIVVDAGVTHTVLTTNGVLNVRGRPISVTDAPGTVITSNTVALGSCGPAVGLAGDSSGSTIENNVLLLGESLPPSCSATPPVDLSVSAASVAGTTADYNLISPKSTAPYVWAGQTYADIASFQAASQQGAHDVSWSGRGTRFQIPEGSPIIDSADADAPGELDTDLAGAPRADDPLTGNSGTGKGYYDRGAFEVQDQLTAWVSPTPWPTPGHPLDAKIDGGATSPWGATTQRSIDFGDGSSPVSVQDPPPYEVFHTYPAPGRYTVTITVTDAVGTTKTGSQILTIADPAPIQPQLTVSQGQGKDQFDPVLLRAEAYPDGTTSPWPVAKYSYDFGDGTPATEDAVHTYTAPGSYKVTMTVTDTQGRTATATRVVTVGNAYVPVSPARLLDTRRSSGPVGPGGVLKLQITGRGEVPANGKVTAVLLNLTATEATAGGFVTAYPTGSSLPTVSSLNLTAGRTVANAVVVPVGPDGSVSLYNKFGNVQLVADVQGYYEDEITSYGSGNLLGVWQPTRVLDTRYGTGAAKGKVGPGGLVQVKVRGAGLLPDAARAVVLNLTATESDTGGYVTANPVGNPPASSNLNFGAGQTVANQITVPIQPDGTVALYNRFGDVHLIADIQGYYAQPPLSGAAAFVATTPARLLDTRDSKQTLGPDSSLRLKVTGTAGVPDGATSVLVNLTATRPTAGGYLTAYAAGAGRPGTSIVNFTAGDTVPNLALVPVSADGYIEIYNHSGDTDVLVDLQGYTG